MDTQDNKNVLLPKDTIPQKLDRDKLDIYRDKIYDYQKEMYKNNTEEFIIQDGEPYANGDLHLGHFLNKTLKDVLTKHYLNIGKKARISFGWDCHGLPIENKAKNLPGCLKDNAYKIALKYSKIQKESLNKFAIFSTETDFRTMDEDFKEREIGLLNKLIDNNYIIKKNKPTWYSPTLGTVLANSEIEYKEFNDESVYFMFDSSCMSYKLLIWTTTEWTISGNQALCVNKDIDYVVTSENYICNEKFAIENGFTYKKFDMSQIDSYINYNGDKCPILYDEYVEDNQTGIVHICGGHGDDDFRILEDNNIVAKNVCDKEELLNHIDTFKIDDKYLFSREPYVHDYPIDWREGNKVYKVLTEQTYLDFDLQKIKKTLKNIKLSSKDRNRLGSTIFSRKDWCISRQREWGVRIPNSNDILDVWFDSGSTFLMYDKPADIYIEGSDQSRGWFQSSVILASMVDKLPTKRIVSHGFVMDETEQKLSKSKGNGGSLDHLYDKYNPDVMRLWVVLSDFKNDIIFSENSMKNAGKQYFKIRNFLRFLYNNLHRSEHLVPSNEKLIDSMNELEEYVNVQTEDMEYSKAIRKIIDYFNRYSATLSVDVKNEFYEADIDDDIRIEMENEFKYIADKLTHMLFPFLPFLSTEFKSL